MITTVLLDVFGTLIDMDPDIYLSPYSHLLAPLGLDQEEKARAGRFIYTTPLPTMDQAADGLEALFGGGPISHEHRNRAQEELLRHLKSHSPVGGALALLEQLKASGLKLALVSNLSTPYREVITSSGIESLVDATIYSFEVGFQKPDPEIYTLALARLGSGPEQTVMIGDDETNDVIVPRSLDMQAREVTPGGEDGGASLERVLRGLLE